MDIKEYISSGIIELYVMGLCSPEEEKELEALRPQYKELHEAILQYEKDMEEKCFGMLLYLMRKQTNRFYSSLHR